MARSVLGRRGGVPVGGRRLGLGPSVGPDLEGARPLDEAAVVPDLDLVERLGVVADLDASSSELGVDLVAAAEQGEDAGLVGGALLPPQEGQAQGLLVGVADLLDALPPALERRVARLLVLRPVVLQVGPGDECLVQGVQGVNGGGLQLGEKG